MQILVTGGTGSIGPAIVRLLLRRGHGVTVLARSRGSMARLPGDVGTFQGDLTDPSSIAGACASADAVVHAAALVGHSARPGDHDAVTARGTGYVLAEAVRAGIHRFVHMSTVAVHRPPAPGVRLNEQSPLWDDAPRWNGYSRAKIDAERRVERAALETGLGTVILRPGLVVGPGDRHATPRMLALLSRGIAFRVGEAANRFPCVTAEDLADAVARAIERPGIEGRSYLVAGRETVTQHELWRLHANAAGLPEPRFSMPRRALEGAAALLEVGAHVMGRRAPFIGRFDVMAMSADVVVDSGRIQADLDWRGDGSIADAVGRAVATQLEHEGFAPEGHAPAWAARA